LAATRSGIFIKAFPAFVAIFCFSPKKAKKQKDFHSIGAKRYDFSNIYKGLGFFQTINKSAVFKERHEFQIFCCFSVVLFRIKK
jgi:hypothetical protein